MSGDPPGDGRSLSGFWHGRYAYPHGRAPTAFTALLQEVGGWISGTTEELSDAGEDSGCGLGAVLQGRRDGRQVRFLKTYDRPNRMRDSVVYEGQVSHDETEITGRWSIPGNWSG